VNKPQPAQTEPVLDRKSAFYREICRRIVSLELKPDAVLDEVVLSEEFGLSRPPIREIMRQLAAEGYVELEANRPVRVASMNYQSIRDFYLAAPFMYTATTQLAALNASANEIAALKKIQQQFCQAINGGDVDARSLHNIRFHQAIGEMAHNAYLLLSLNRLLIDHARIGKVFYRYPTALEATHNWDMAVAHHEQMIAAIQSHQTEGIEQIVTVHFELSRQSLIDYVTPPEKALSLSLFKNNPRGGKNGRPTAKSRNIPARR